jgi:hypothetical protein
MISSRPKPLSPRTMIRAWRQRLRIAATIFFQCRHHSLGRAVIAGAQLRP